MFTRFTNLEGILHTPMCCKCEQEIVPIADSQLRSRIPILRIRICTGGPICVTDLQCTLVHSPCLRWNAHFVFMFKLSPELLLALLDLRDILPQLKLGRVVVAVSQIDLERSHLLESVSVLISNLDVQIIDRLGLEVQARPDARRGTIRDGHNARQLVNHKQIGTVTGEPVTERASAKVARVEVRRGDGGDSGARLRRLGDGRRVHGLREAGAVVVDVDDGDDDGRGGGEPLARPLLLGREDEDELALVGVFVVERRLLQADRRGN